jgi:serine/threonine protein kinase
MQARSASHPSDRLLRDYGDGKLDADVAEGLAAHLDECRECLNEVARFSPDNFLEAVRRARSLESHQPGEAVGDDQTRSSRTHANAPQSRATAHAGAALSEGVPEELGKHPDYEVLRELGRGGMGVVYLAHNRFMGRDEVLKVMDRNLMQRPDVIERFEREIRAVARLRHPNIVTAYAAFPCAGTIVFAMEYVAGDDLARVVKTGGPLPVSHACYYAYQVALALQHANEHGTVHRDIKPGNLMLFRRGNRPIVKVLDFGLAKVNLESKTIGCQQIEMAAPQESACGLTLEGQVLGTPQFIAPEQIADSQSADIRADIYSLGCTLYCLVTGRPPFEAKTLYDVIQAHRTIDAQPLNIRRPEVPASLAAVVARMMAKSPGRRFQTPGEVALALKPFFTKRATLASPSADITPSRREAAPTDATEDRPESTQESKPGLVSQPRSFRPSRRTMVTLAFILIGALGTLLLSIHHGGRWPPATPQARQQVRGVAPEIPPLGTSRASPEPNQQTTGLSPSRSAMSTVAAPAGPAVQQAHVAVSSPTPARIAPLPSKPAATQRPGSPSPRAATIASTSDKPVPLFKRPPWALEDRVQRAMRDGVNYLISKQRENGSWEDLYLHQPARTTCGVTMALLVAGEKADSRAVRLALTYLRRYGPEELRSAVSVANQTVVFLAAEPEKDWDRIRFNVDWLQRAQIRSEDGINSPGSWAYTFELGRRSGDMDSTHNVLLCLRSARRMGITVSPEVWDLSRKFWVGMQRPDGGWSYDPGAGSSEVDWSTIAVRQLMNCRQGAVPIGPAPRGVPRLLAPERLASDGNSVVNCGRDSRDLVVEAGIEWLSRNLETGDNFPASKRGGMSSLINLAGISHLTGERSLGRYDLYRAGVEVVLHSQNSREGFWRAVGDDRNELLETGGALGFLAWARAPRLISKLKHPPGSDWKNDPDDIRVLVDSVARDQRTILTWQVVDPAEAPIAELLQAPIAFLSGHEAPDLGAEARRTLRGYLDQGGFLLADACCSRTDFDSGFRRLMRELFAGEEGSTLERLTKDHPVWRTGHQIEPGSYPLWGIERGGRTVVVYSPMDLSCFWNQAERVQANPRVDLALKIGQNLIHLVETQNQSAVTEPHPGQVPASSDRESAEAPARQKTKSSTDSRQSSRFRGRPDVEPAFHE